jgi:hypothetical protein
MLRRHREASRRREAFSIARIQDTSSSPLIVFHDGMAWAAGAADECVKKRPPF